MKHLLTSVILLLAMLLPTTASAHDFEVDGIYYNRNGNKASVTYRGSYSSQYYNEYSGDISIPSTVTYNGTTYTVTSINSEAFSFCSDLTSVSIPNSVTSIDYRAFSCCSGLTGIIVDSGNSTYDSRDNCNAIINTVSNTLITGCQSSFIPNSVTSIGSCAFSGCSGLTNVTIPNSVTFIGYQAFYGCSGLTNISIPGSVTYIGEGAFNGCSGLTSITIPNSVTNVGMDAFYNTAWYNNLPDGLVYAGLVAYKYKGTMPAGTSITLRDGTLGVAGGAFSSCSGLASISIPNSVTSIGYQAFSDCSELANIIIPNSVTSIGEWAFENCYGLISATIGSSVTFIGGGAFYHCSSLASINIPNSVTSIGDCAFKGCEALTSIDIPNSVNSIGGYAFCDCSGLTSITISNAVTHISEYTFCGCSGLTSITIPNAVTYIDQYAFIWCSSLTSITIPNSVTNIGDWAFERCSGLTSITIPNSVTYIGSEAFAYCSGLMDVFSYITDLSEGIYGDTFYLESANYSNRTLHVPYGTSAAYQASSWGPYFGTIVEMDAGETNYFSMADSTVMHGDIINIPIAMTNNMDIMAFQTDICLPEGFTLVTDEDGEPIITPSERLTSDHVILADQLNDGSVRVICYTPRSKVISGNDGDLFYITVAVPEEAGGDYTLYLRNSLLTTTDYEELNIPDAGAVLTVNTYIPGDVNDSRTVNVTDIVVTAQYILQRNPSPFIFEAADMNGDGNITVTDIMLIARLIMTPPANAPKRMPAITANGDRMSGETIAIVDGETRTVSLALDNVMDYSAFQLDLNLPEGLTAGNFQLTDRAGNHILDVEAVGNGKLRSLCYSPAIAAINGSDGALLTFDVTANGPVTGDIMVDGIEFVTTACQPVLFDAFTIGVDNMTAVNEVATGKTVAHVDYFNLAGQRIDRPESGVTLVVTTYTDGTRTTTKLHR